MARKKMRDSWGSIAEVERGKRYRIRYWAETPDGYRRCSVTVRGTLRDAEKRRAELMLAHGDDAPCPTVSQVWRLYVLPMYESKLETGDIARNTLRSYSLSWDSVVEPRWGDVPCDGVRPLAIQQWLSTLTLTQAQIGLQLLTTALNTAFRYEFIERNPAKEEYVMPSASTRRRRDSGVWTYEELGLVWETVIAVAPWIEASFVIAAFGGARVGESLAVKAGDVTLGEVDGVPVAYVSIERQMTKPYGVTERLKTQASRRTIVIPGRAAARLGEIAGRLGPDVPLTNDGFGGWTTRDRANNAWRLKVLPALPEGQRHPYQNLRNSWQTNCRWTLGIQPYYIESLMGHKNPGITGQHYDRPQAEMFAEVVVGAYAKVRYDEGWTFLD